MRRGFLIARIRGIEIRADPSLLFLGALITYNLWLFYSSSGTELSIVWFRIRSISPPLSSGAALSLAVLTTILFFASILAHEGAHAVAFRVRGIAVRGITLFMFGGYTVGATEADKPLDEGLIAAVGPATTGLLGVAFLGLHVAAAGTGMHAYRAMFGYLAALNLFMGAFNILPGLPLDGGRVLMAVLWRVTGERTRATRLAARSGKIVAGVILGWGIVLLTGTGDLGGIWLLLIGSMLYSGATATLAQSQQARLLESARAADVMSPPPPTVPANLPVDVAVDRLLAERPGEAFPVVDDHGVIGFISLRLARDARPEQTVRDAMVGTEAVAVADPTEPMAKIVERIRDRRAQVTLVVDDGRLVGVIEPEDLARFFRTGRRKPRAGSVAAPPRPDRPEGGAS
jgi:Zn-dependent protease